MANLGFSKMTAATETEVKKFSKMNEALLAPLIRDGRALDISVAEVKDAFGPNGKRFGSFQCTDSYSTTSASARSFQCLVLFDINHVQSGFKEIVELGKKSLGSGPVSELRYGDINDDGKIDFAIRVEGGAIYVFRGK